MSAFGGKADVIQAKADIKKCSLMTQSGDCGRKVLARRSLVYISDNDRLATVIVAIHPHIKSVV
jgi:hypothetical protein